MRRVLFLACALAIAGCGKSGPTHTGMPFDPAQQYKQGQSPQPGKDGKDSKDGTKGAEGGKN